MKGQISRDSFRPRQRYSGVYQIQGGMVTDADLGEKSRIGKSQIDQLGDDAIRDGVPDAGGAVAIGVGDAPELQEGVVYADGVRGQLTAADPTTLAGPLDLFTNQADLPHGPALPGGRKVVYADVWERPVFALEDEYLADSGLHGAETAFRTRTMTQLKAIELASGGGAEDSPTALEVEAALADLPRIGTAELALSAHTPEALIDECDPCADVVAAEQAIANALWRLEVIAVDGPPESPEGLTLAWSIENGSAIAPAKVEAEAFERAGKVYEFFSVTTESHRGVFEDPTDARRPAFVDDLATTPDPATDYDGSEWPFVRRWDGHAVVDLANETAVTLGSGFTLDVGGAEIELTVDAFTATLDVGGAAVVAGDYWLVELRSFAATADKIRRVQATPIGIEHHYCALFAIDGGAALTLSDSLVRKVSFPTLAGLPATHVGFDNNCPKLYGDAENVQEALDELCSISADDVAFDPQTCPELYAGADNVHDALANLCNVDFSSSDRAFRLLHDWGVVCGIVPRLIGELSRFIEISAGSFLDRSGHLATYEGATVDLGDLPPDQIHFADAAALRDALRDGEVCLALAAAGGQVSVHLVPKDQAFGPADPSFTELVRDCIEGASPIPIDGVFQALDPEDQVVAEKLFLVVNKRSSFAGSAKLTTEEAGRAAGINQQIFDEFKSVASEEEVSALEADWQTIADEIQVESAQGETREIRMMQLHSRQMAAVFEQDQDREERCICNLLFPSCPPDLGEPPYFVPIACLTGSFDVEILIENVCPYCCRKQAMTWRSVQYLFGELRTLVGEELASSCCGSGEDDDEPGAQPGFTYRPGYYKDLTLPKVSQLYGLEEILTGPPARTPSDYATRVDVEDLSPDEAKTALLGNGVDVTTEIDLDDPEAFDDIQAKTLQIDPAERLGDDGRIRPGDKVALLVQDGVARDYVLLERGAGKYLFETETATAKPTIPADEIERAESLIESAEAARGSLVELESRRDSLAEEVTQLQDEIEALSFQRKGLVESLRKNQPMQSISKDPELVSKLAENGMTFVGEVKTEVLDQMVASKTITRAEADAIELTAQVYIEKQL